MERYGLKKTSGGDPVICRIPEPDRRQITRMRCIRLIIFSADTVLHICVLLRLSSWLKTFVSGLSPAVNRYAP